MNQRSEHLSDAQIEQFGKRASGAGPETEAWVETHLDDCPSCRSRVLEFQRTQFALLPDPKVNTVSSPNCPGEEDLRSLAAGLSAEPTANKLKAHASNCERCAPLLQEYIEDFSDESSPEEQAFLNQLRTASPEFRQQAAREMLAREMLKKNLVTPAHVPATDWRRFFSWKWILIPATAVIALAAITVPVYLARRDTPEKVEMLLAQAATEQRTMEVRWPGAAWGHLHRTRAIQPKETNQPLLRAEELIIKNHFNTNANISWRRLQAEAELLDGNAEAAIEKLHAMLKQQPDSVPLLMDISIAYFQLAETGKDPNAYRASLECLSQVLNVEPGNTAAMFNQALVFERLGETQNAISAWKTLLISESDPGWKEEAQRHLKMLEN